MRTLLVAEDDAVLHAALSELLTWEGYRVVSASCLAEAEQQRLLHAVDAAVIDWHLGPERTDDLLARLVEQGVVTILLSAHPDARVLAEGIGIPCVHKPFVVDQLLGILSGAISRRTLRRIAVAR